MKPSNDETTFEEDHQLDITDHDLKVQYSNSSTPYLKKFALFLILILVISLCIYSFIFSSASHQTSDSKTLFQLPKSKLNKTDNLKNITSTTTVNTIKNDPITTVNTTKYNPITTENPPTLALTTCQKYGWPTYSGNISTRKIYDLLLLNSELDWLEIRLAEMWDEVDYFVIVESPMTFTGLPKKLFLQEHWDRFAKYQSKIIRHTLIIPTSVSENPWTNEKFQRNATYEQVIPNLVGAQKIQEGDILLASDIDEIVASDVLKNLRVCQFPSKLTLNTQLFYYSYEFKDRGDWPHPQATYYMGLDTILPDDLRITGFDPATPVYYGAGWHCSYCFRRIEEVVEKLKSFSHQEFNRPEYTNRAKILNRVLNGLDLFNRHWVSFEHIIDNQNVPEFVKKNKQRFIYLIKREAPTGNFEDYVPSDSHLP